MSGWKPSRINITSGTVTGVAARGPDADRAALRAIQAAAQARDFQTAAALAERALGNGLAHPLVLNVLAYRLEEQGKLAEALEMLRRGEASGDLGLRQAAGLLRLRLERPAEALADFDAVAAAQPQFAPAHAARGQALAAIGRVKEAEAAFARALALQADNIAALNGLAALRSRAGAHAEARALAERVLAVQPDFPEAVMTLASAELAAGEAPAAQTRLQRLIADPRLSDTERALAQGLLGDVLDAQDRVDEAFAAYQACNMGLWRAYAPAREGAVNALDFAREMLERLETLPPEIWRGGAAEPPAGVRGHVFLLGFPRSGTTLLEQVLAGHPDVEALEERETLEAAARTYLSTPDDLFRLADAPQAELVRLRAAYWDRVEAEGARPKGKVFVDKHPFNTFKLPLIAKLFPDAKILFARRDPRDVVLSCFRRRFAMSNSAYQLLTLPGAARFYAAAMEIAERLEPALEARTLVVRHESLVEDFDAVAGEVCAFLDLPWTEALRAFSERVAERGVATPSGAQLAGGLSAEGVGQWRRYREPLAPVLPILAPWVARFGYEPHG